MTSGNDSRLRKLVRCPYCKGYTKVREDRFEAHLRKVHPESKDSSGLTAAGRPTNAQTRRVATQAAHPAKPPDAGTAPPSDADMMATVNRAAVPDYLYRRHTAAAKKESAFLMKHESSQKGASGRLGSTPPW